MSSTGLAHEAISSADHNAKLQAISASGACADGRVITLDFAAIQRRLGARWDAKRADVGVKLGQIIERHAGRNAIWLRIVECEYLICLSVEDAAGAQAMGFRIMEEALAHFLGCFTPQDLAVNRVTSITGGVVSRVPVEPDGSPFRPTPARNPVGIPPEPKSFEPSLVVEGPTDSLILNCILEEIVSLKTHAVVGLRIAPQFYSQRSRRMLTIPERASLSTRALMAMDQLVVQAISVLFDERAPALLLAPISLHTFGASRARLPVVEELNRLHPDQRNRLIIELGGFELGTPSSRLTEAASMLKPFCRAVAAQPIPSRSGVTGVVNARLTSLSVSARDLGGDGARLASGLLAFGEAVKGVFAMLIAPDLPAETFLSVCTVAGFNFAAIDRAKMNWGEDRTLSATR